jgi:hypothetical protein
VAAYDDAVRELYQTPVARFVAERKRLAGELRAAGDVAGATALAKLPRPTISAWVVNQLYWHARDAFDKLLATAERLRGGELAASTAHRDALANLRGRAASMLKDAGHAPTEATLRRVTSTLSALSAVGSFEPDPPGALAADRDPPGFEAAGIPAATPHDGHANVGRAHDGHARDAASERRAREQAEREREKLRAERHRLEAALRTARGDVAAREREVRTLDRQLEVAQRAVADAQKIVDALEERLAELGD